METKIQFFSDMQGENSFHFLYLADETSCRNDFSTGTVNGIASRKEHKSDTA